MISTVEPMGAPSSFTARRPNASNLPQFELPPPQQLPAFHKYHTAYGHHPGQSHGQHPPTSITNVGNLPTPPSGSSVGGMSPVTSAGAAGGSQSIAPYTPGAYSWHQPASATTPYGYNSTPSETPSYSNSIPMTAPLSLPSVPNGQHHMAMAASGPMSAPLSAPAGMMQQDAFGRAQPPTPGYYQTPHSATAAHAPYSYATNGHVQQSPISGGTSAGNTFSRLSPTNLSGQMPSIHSQSSFGTSRPFSFPVSGPVMSNMGNAGAQMSMVGGIAHGMMGYNSGHAAHMQHAYGHNAANAATPLDRPFKCDTCPQSFNRNHDLKRHKRIHLAVKPFPCGHCDKSFSRKDALKRHILVKGCGKASSGGADRGSGSDGSISPSIKSDADTRSPTITAPV